MADIKKVLDKMIEQIKEKGADSGQVFVTESEDTEFNAEHGELSLLRTLFNQDINLIVYKDQKKGSYFSNKLDDASIDHAVSMAMTSMESCKQDEAYGIIAPYQGEITANKGVYEPDTDLLFKRMKELLDDIKEHHPLIIVQEMIISHHRRHMVFANTNGTTCDEYTGFYTVSLGIAGHQGDITTSMNECGFQLINLDEPWTENEYIKRKIRYTEGQIAMKPIEQSFTGTMVLTPDCLAMFLYYIIGLVEGAAILEKTSIWLTKLQQQVADPKITIRLDPNDTNVLCGETITIDGFKSEGYDIIKEGNLVRFCINHYVAKKTGYEMRGNGAYNLMITPGEESIDDIIKRIDHGILVDGFSGGQPPVNGDFSGVAKNSYLIENGKITKSVTEAMINGNLAAMLMELEGISSEVLKDGCNMIPYMAFRGILVSGK